MAESPPPSHASEESGGTSGLVSVSTTRQAVSTKQKKKKKKPETADGEPHMQQAPETPDHESRDVSPPADTPPYWTRTRTQSYHSLTPHQQPHNILLEDHSDDPHSASHSCWARSVTVDNYTILTGPTGIGAHVVWLCTVSTLHGGDLQLRKRYSEFDELRSNLIEAFPHAGVMIPRLPRKSVVSRFRPEFLEQRRAGLGEFMSCVLLNPEFAGSAVLKEFVFSG
ncbi:hypothetical protein LTR62_006521 [Meristemomyces frigidus]|uniref:Endosomal/vacuolar adapter protein YPT35 n=1 Tax=Meristemomyces frigidus TaxID=1508187 RepID=A0AAN7TBX3_9PEZI|nr:hypothetical protein LTR62_006521 [Meristemomyces frigidus]